MLVRRFPIELLLVGDCYVVLCLGCGLLHYSFDCFFVVGLLLSFLVV